MTPSRKTVLLFFLGMLSLYLSFSPFTISGMGYAGEEINTCRQLFAGRALGSIEWPRNGGASLLVECPFVSIGALTGQEAAWDERLFALAPVLSSAALVTLLFVWCSRLAGSLTWGLCLAVVAGFCTLLWPYAYIGLETTQSLFLLLAGFLALGSNGPRTWRRSLLFGLSAGIALSAKSGGFLLAPAIAFLTWDLFFGKRRGPRELGKAIASSSLIVLIFAVNNWTRALSWQRFGGMVSFARGWLERDLVSPFLNLVALVGSPNKGLIVYAPVTILALIAIPRAWKANRPVTAFALITFAGLAGGLATLQMWSDETWGPRYLHSCIGPLVLCLGAAKSGVRFRIRSEVTLFAAAILGLGVSFLGSAFYYGSVGGVASETAPLTLEALQGDPVWNHVRFNARLFTIWLRTLCGRAPEAALLRPARPWDFLHSDRIPPWNKVNLKPYATPQPLMLRAATADLPPVDRALVRLSLLLLVSGALCLAGATRIAHAQDAVRQR